MLGSQGVLDVLFVLGEEKTPHSAVCLYLKL